MSSSSQKRARQQLSCTGCRNGKLRCNRQQPCDQCIKRSRDSACQYLAAPPKKKHNRNTKDRIAHLESLVLQLMARDGAVQSEASPQSQTENGSSTSDGYSSNLPSSNQSLSKDSPGSSTDGVVPDPHAFEFGQLTISKGGAHYKGAAHWEAILDGIAEVKDTIDDDNESEDNEPEKRDVHVTPMVVLGAPTSISRELLIKSLPKKEIAEKLVWTWFHSPDPGLPAVHQPSFMEQFEQLYQDPSNIPTMWISLFFSAMALGRIAINYSPSAESDQASIDKLGSAGQYQELAAAALALADYTKPKKYAVEALVAYSSCDYLTTDGPKMRLWLLTAIAIRTALRMGYHRDASHFPNISPFEGEMRRRIWTLVTIFDILQSYEFGLPSMIQTVQADTKCPRNILDTDFGPDSKILPPPRPIIELSPVSYGIVKSDLAGVFARACDLSHNVVPPAYEEILELDRRLQEVYQAIPPGLQFVRFEVSPSDQSATIYHRFKLELMAQKTRCVLHRRYLTADVVGTQMELSRKLCVEAAMKVLAHHQSVYVASQDGGLLKIARAFMSAMNTHDFLLAAMIICMELELISKATSDATSGPNADKVDVMRQLIETSYNIYKQPDQCYSNSAKAVKAMGIMLKRIGPAKNTIGGPSVDYIHTGLEDLDPNEANNNDWNPALSMNTDIDLFDPTIDGMFSTDMDWQNWDNVILDNPQVIQTTSPWDQVLWPPVTSDPILSSATGFGLNSIDLSRTQFDGVFNGGVGRSGLIGCGMIPFSDPNVNGQM